MACYGRASIPDTSLLSQVRGRDCRIEKCTECVKETEELGTTPLVTVTLKRTKQKHNICIILPRKLMFVKVIEKNRNLQEIVKVSLGAISIISASKLFLVALNLSKNKQYLLGQRKDRDLAPQSALWLHLPYL